VPPYALSLQPLFSVSLSKTLNKVVIELLNQKDNVVDFATAKERVRKIPLAEIIQRKKALFYYNQIDDETKDLLLGHMVKKLSSK
jgi:hypothetical protein